MPDPLDHAVTIKIHHGGQFCNIPPVYVGGSVSVFDHIGLNYVDIPYLDRLCEKIGYKGLKKYYKLDEGEIGGEVESNEEPLELNERNDDSRDSEDFLDSDYDLGSEDGEGENNGVDEDDELFTRHVDEEVEWAAEIEQAMQAAEALFSVESQSSMNLTYDTQARKRQLHQQETSHMTQMFHETPILGKNLRLPKAGPKKPTWQDITLRRSTRLNAPVTGGEGGMNSMPIPAAFKPPRPAPVPTLTQTPVPRCVMRPPVPFAPRHPNVAISITTKQNNPYHHLSKHSRKMKKNM
ncbi:hypothetical protein Salat_1014500 [Sesamum alatum]|uniref:PB1-like domain-containing protein n=1 Tax=Sesamum alatum TaxID=300844 RepID=A0AAE1YMW1_9LAMI|nr:hypothetical protein Salat_1014500 [Sesamum alatum]